MSAGQAGLFVVGVVFVGFCLAFFFPTRDDLKAFERIEESLEPTTYLELGLVLVVLAAVCVAATVFKHVVGAP